MDYFKMRKVITITIALIMVLATATACGNSDSGSSEPAGSSGGSAAEVEDSASGTDTSNAEYVLRIGTGTGGRHPQNVFMEAFEVAFEEATNGAVDVQLYPAGQLGTMAELIQGLSDGTVDAGCFPTSYYSTNFPAAACTDLSFSFRDSEQLWRILTENDTKFQALFEDNGIIVGSWLRSCDRAIISTGKITTMAELKNKVLWTTPSNVIRKEVELLGATSSNIDTGELAPSLANGTLDGAIADITLYRAQSLQNNGGKYLLQAPNDALIVCFGISRAWWDKVPEDIREQARDIAQQVVLDVQYPYIDEFLEEAYATMTSGGMEIVEPDEALWADMEAALAPQKDWFMKEYPGAQEIYDELIALAEKTN
jgi:TRAP-type C4-dicarboxylate transport system substrate-binding protein